MKVTDVSPAAAHHREDHRHPRGRADAGVPGGDGRQQDRHPARGRAAARLEGRRASARRSLMASSSARASSSAAGRTGRRPTYGCGTARSCPTSCRGRREIMAIRNYNPTSPGVRGKTSLTFDEITTNEPYRPLTENAPHAPGGRNNKGRPDVMVARWRSQAALPHHRFQARQEATSRRRWRRSSTTRTARRGSRC